MTTHLLAVVGLAVVCGLWVALQLVAGADGEASGGRCGACREREDRSDRPKPPPAGPLG